MPLTRALASAALLVVSAAQAEEPNPLFGVPLLQIDGLEDPSGACFDESGVLHVSEARAHRVTSFAADGTRLESWGDDGTLSWPRDLACLPGGGLAVLSTGDGQVVTARLDGSDRARVGLPGHGRGQMHDPRAIAVRGDELLIADTGNDRVLLLRQVEGCDAPFCYEPALRLGPFEAPRGIGVLADGSILVADTQADRLVRLAGEDFSETSWGARGEAPGLFSRPTGLAVSSGRVYSVDTENHRVQVFDDQGALLGGWGRHAWLPHEGDGKLHYPEVLAIDEARGVAAICEPFEDRCQLFARGEQPPDPARDRVTRRVDRSSHYGRRISMAGRLIALTEMDGTSVSFMDLPREIPILIHRIGRPGEGHGLFRDAVAALVDGPKRVVVADAGARRIATFAHDLDLDAPTRFDPRLSRLVREIDLTKVRIEPRIRPIALARGPGDELFVLDAAGSRVVVLDRAGRVLREFGSFGQMPGQFRFPTEIVFDASSERLLVVDAGNQRVQLFDPEGRRLLHFGGPDAFVEPFGACFGREGRMFVTDRGGHFVRRFDPDGRFELEWGAVEPDAPASERLGAGQLHRPTGIVLSDRGELLVVDHGNHRGQVFSTDGEFLRAFGARLYTRPTRGPRQEDGDAK